MSAPGWVLGPIRGLSYQATWDLQKEVQAARIQGAIPDVLLLVEHAPVITLGRGADPGNLVASKAWLEAQGVEVFPIDRGGDITYHGPGQITGYALFDLNDRGRDLHRFLRDLEEVQIRYLKTLGIEAGRIEGLTGAWIGHAKVAAMGVKVRRWVSMHGFSLNVDPDLNHFRWIVPCGIQDKPVTSIAEALGEAPPSFEEACQGVTASFEDVFAKSFESRTLAELRAELPPSDPI